MGFYCHQSPSLSPPLLFWMSLSSSHFSLAPVADASSFCRGQTLIVSHHSIRAVPPFFIISLSMPKGQREGDAERSEAARVARRALCRR